MHKRFSVAALVIGMIFVPLAGRLCAADEKSDSGAALALRLTELAQRILRAASPPRDETIGQATANGSEADRFNALLALLRSNPCQPDLIIELSRQLAANGLVNDAIKWYNFAGLIWQHSHQAPLIPIIIEVASEYFVGDQMQQ